MKVLPFPCFQVVNGVRSVVLTRPFKGASGDHYTFDPVTSATLDVIMASGPGSDYGYHGPATRGGEPIHLVAMDAPTCVCNVGIKGRYRRGTDVWDSWTDLFLGKVKTSTICTG